MIAILALSPIMILIAFLIRIEDGHSVFFRQARVGLNGRLFQVIKFRSMPVNTKNVPSAEAGELKVTTIGKILRRTNLDELPQLFNILKGDMSVVGPRPALERQKDLYELRDKLGVTKHKPGLTGLAQIKSFDGMSDFEKARFDAIYCNNITFFGDMAIILRTFGYLLRPPPVY
ncbi:MAG: sugar transferase [Magnetococcus sp. YQC-5]